MIGENGSVMTDVQSNEGPTEVAHSFPRHHKVRPLNIEWDGRIGYRVTQKVPNGGHSFRHRIPPAHVKQHSGNLFSETNAEPIAHNLSDSRPESPVLLIDELEPTPLHQRSWTTTPTNKRYEEADSSPRRIALKNTSNDSNDYSELNDHANRQKLILFDAPPSLKTGAIKPPHGRVEPFYVDGSKIFSRRPTPVVVERRYRPSPSLSPLRRTATLPVHGTAAREKSKLDETFHIAKDSLRRHQVARLNRSYERSEHRQYEVQKNYEKPLQIDDSEGNQLKLPSLSSSISVRNVGNPLCSEFATAEPSDATDSTTTLRDGGLLRETLNPQWTHNPNHVKIMKHINSVDTNNEHVKTATSSLIPTKPLRSVRSNPSSPILGKPHEHCSVYKGSVSPHRTPSANKNQGNVSGLPPAPRRASPNRSTRRDPATGAVLSPTGPPVEQVSTLIEPATGQQKQVTTRSQSFTDLNRNVILTELDETIESDETMEHCIKKRLVRKGHNNSVRERKSTDRTDNSPRQLSTKHENALPTVPDRMGLTAEKQLREKIDEIEELITELKTRSNQLVKATDSTIKPYPMSSWAVSQATPGRATSQTNIPGYTSLGRPQWTSDLNIRSTTNYKQMPMHSTYSAHRENMQRREEQRRATEAEQRSTRYFDDSKVAGGAEVLEEVETITLQPIGRGVHDLEPTGSVGRSYRAYTPTGSVQSIRSVPIRWSKIQPENLTRFHSQQQETGHRGWAHQMSAQSPKLVHESASADFFNFIGTPVIHSGPFPYSNSAEFQGPLRVDTTSYRPRHQGRQNLSPLGITRSLPRTTGSASPRNCEQRSPKGMVVRRPMFSTLNAHESSSPASRAYTPGPDQSDGYRTIATTNVHREIPTSGGPSPFAGIRQNSLYEGRGSENRYRTSQPLDSHWRATTVPPNYAGSVSGMSASGDASEWEQVLLKQVKNTFREWYMPEKSREDVENLLRDREPGSFIVRNRLSHENSFSLGLKAPGLPDPYRHGSIKHYIINSVPMHDGRGTGLQLSGFSDQPVFPDFVSFVHHHCMHAGPFPCALRLPISFASSQPPSNAYGSINKVKMPAGGGGVVVDMLYLGSVQVDKLETLSAVRKAVTKILGQASTNGKGLSKRSVVTVSAKPNEGVRFSGSTKRGKMDESIKPSDISFCGLDPEGRTFSGEELRARGLTQARMFGIVARSKPIWMHGNLVFVFSELDPNQSALSLISYINQVFVS
ncbi:unnamed protein product [Dicrocoelium dendriticum]|nr:unnamed protein product [Dicrocoelium dendriticum]